jgi:hypothetical protein
MPVPPGPFVVKCTHCRWRKIVAPMSDVIFPGEIPSCCPRCRSPKLERRNANILERQWAEFRRPFWL